MAVLTPDLGDYIGIPFVWGGRERSTGLDCWGLLRLVQREVFGRDLPTHAHAERNMKTFSVCEESQDALIGDIAPTEVPIASAREGDVVLMRDVAAPGALVRHVATFAGRGRVLHTVEGSESRIERLDKRGSLWQVLKTYRLA